MCGMDVCGLDWSADVDLRPVDIVVVFYYEIGIVVRQDIEYV